MVFLTILCSGNVLAAQSGGKNESPADFSFSMPIDKVLTNLPLMLNFTQFHTEFCTFRKCNSSNVYSTTLYPSEDTVFSNEFERNRAMKSAEERLKQVELESKKVRKEIVPLLEIDNVSFTFGDYAFASKAFYSSVAFEPSSNVRKELVGQKYVNETAPTTYLGVNLPSQKVKIDIYGMAIISMNETDAERFSENASPYRGESRIHYGKKSYRGKAYYKIVRLDNGYVDDFSDGLKSGGSLQLVAFKIYDGKRNIIFQSDYTYWNVPSERKEAKINNVDLSRM